MQLSIYNIIFRNPAGLRCCAAKPLLTVVSWIKLWCFHRELVCVYTYIYMNLTSFLKGINFVKCAPCLPSECRLLQWCMTSVGPDEHLLKTIYVTYSLMFAANDIVWVVLLNSCVCTHATSEQLIWLTLCQSLVCESLCCEGKIIGEEVKNMWGTGGTEL